MGRGSYPVALHNLSLSSVSGHLQDWRRYPDLSQESGSPFVFICTNPQEMVLKFPIKGKHKIWKLDAKIHQGAKKGLMKQKAVG
ncbi:hypothetical protein DV515_00006241 [Chloebia gouldiae]|uniref:Uncharacterized protein n=1 Tax=Chloebia gouldiae TaxID=44316 RepID=A0A3L8SKH9_CHLGU|nr:hypothetical protein DV515_00006241 [Chloebia gouldiae]